MPKRKYTVVYTVEGSHPMLSTMRYEEHKAASQKLAKALGQDIAKAAGGDFIAAYSSAFKGASARDFRRAVRYRNPESFVSFDLKHRHKGRPIKGVRLLHSWTTE